MEAGTGAMGHRPGNVRGSWSYRKKGESPGMDPPPEPTQDPLDFRLRPPEPCEGTALSV